MKIKMFQHILFSIRIPKRNIFKGNVSLNFFPVFLFGMKHIPVFFLHLRTVTDIRFLLQQICNTLNISLAGNQIRQKSCKLLNRFKNHHCIRNKNRKGAKLQKFFLYHMSAPFQYNGTGNGAKKQNCRNINCI